MWCDASAVTGKKKSLNLILYLKLYYDININGLNWFNAFFLE